MTVSINVRVLDRDAIRIHDRTFRLPAGEHDAFRYAEDLRVLLEQLIAGSPQRRQALERQLSLMSVLPPRAQLEGLLDQAA